MNPSDATKATPTNRSERNRIARLMLVVLVAFATLSVAAGVRPTTAHGVISVFDAAAR